jgi:SAM-dependent methyltransferase
MAGRVKYYEPEHHVGYERIRAAGLSAWGQLHGEASFEDAEIRGVLAEVMPRLSFDTPSPTALEYGCGTGPGACLLAERGFRVLGVDLSSVAIDIARREAARRGLDIEYTAADVCDPGFRLDRRFNLVLDSFCLQGIVTDEDRARVFSFVRSALTPRGSYVIATAGYSPSRDYGPCRFDPASGMVFEPTGAGGWLPCRRHVKPHKLWEELRKGVFCVEWSRVAGDGDIALIARHAASAQNG